MGVPASKTLFFCGACGFETPRWLGRCPTCDAWNTFTEAPTASKKKSRLPVRTMTDNMPIRLADVKPLRERRRPSGMPEFDHLLGGGIVPGSLVLVGGPPGTGKSTLLLQIAALVSDQGGKVVYVCAEESTAQAKLRAERLGIGADILLYAQTDLRQVLDAVEQVKPDVLIIDSIQTVALPEAESYAGSVAQVRDCTMALMEYAKRAECATFLVGHVTKDGQIAGPRLLEHLVDVVLYFEGDLGGEYRIVRASKNRFGSVDEICVFSMEADGLREVANPSELFLGMAIHNDSRPSGSCVVPCVVGSRPVLVEVQALVGESAYGTPRRLAANLDQARLSMIIAVLERRVGLALGGHDIYTSVAGGLRINEPAADLAIALAIASSFRNVPLAPRACAFGELGLSGEVRAVSAASRRIAEAARLGFQPVIGPMTEPRAAKRDGIIVVRDLREAIERSLAR